MPGRRILLSAGGGRAPIWRGDSRELYYWQGDQLIAAALESPRGGDPPEVRRRTIQFRAPEIESSVGYDVSPDGTRFAVVFGALRASRLVIALQALDSDAQRAEHLRRH